MNLIKKYLVLFIFCIAYSLVGQVAGAVSFNCEKAQSAIEKMICSDESLSAVDSELAKVFSALKTHIADKSSIVSDQRNWLKVVRDKCETVVCLQEAYQARSGYLSRLNARLQLAGKESQKCEVATPKQTKSGCKIGTVVCVENSNYSLLQAVSSLCGKVVDEVTQDMNINVYIYPRKESSAILVGTINEKETNIINGDILWGEPDRNGFAELYVVDGCGQNCSTGFYRFDFEKQIMYYYFGGSLNGDMSLSNSYFDGYLLNKGVGGAAEYEYNVHKIHQVGSRDIVDKDYFVIEYNGVIGNGNSCKFYKKYDKNQNYTEVSPPDKKWYKYCSKTGVAGVGEGF
jgi:uncharacterized protein